MHNYALLCKRLNLLSKNNNSRIQVTLKKNFRNIKYNAQIQETNLLSKVFEW